MSAVVEQTDVAVDVVDGPTPRTRSLVLNRPDRGNAVDLAMATSLLAAAREIVRLSAAGEIDCLLVRAEGRSFSVGGDLRDFPPAGPTAVAHLHAMTVLVNEAMALLLELPIPVVARVHGVAAGAGIGLAAFADVVIASTAARFKAAYPTVALSPDCAVSWVVPRLVGERRAMDMMLTNRTVDAVEAERWGLVSRVVAPDDLDAEVTDIVTSIVSAGRESAIATKRLLRAGRGSAGEVLRPHLADEGTTIAVLGGGEASARARAAFLDGARPQDRRPA